MTEQEYRKLDLLNASTLKPYLGDPRRAHWIEQNGREDTSCLSLGRAAHSILEHDLTMDGLDISPYDEFRTKEAKAWRDSHPNGIKKKEADTAFSMSHAVYDSFDENLLYHYKNGEREKVFTSKNFKALADLHCDGHLYDYKTTSQEDLGGCIRDIHKFKYALQAALYMEVAKAKSFTFIFVTSNDPHLTFHIKCSKSLILYGMEQMQKAIDIRENFIANPKPKVELELEAPEWWLKDKEEDMPW